MGVTGLWKLIEPCGKPVPVETLEGKILAIDISIWLHQVIKGFQDNKGSALTNAHLLGLFHRLCKLLYYRVRPVFVFDGCTPQLKKDTIARRQQQRSKLNTEADRIQALLMKALAQEEIVQQALGANAALLLKSPTKYKPKQQENNKFDIFKLPEIPSTSKTSTNNENDDEDEDSFSTSLNDYTSTDDSSFDESAAHKTYNTNLQAIDVRSQHFLDLPADVRHEILLDIKETRKQNSWGRLHELPSKSDDFSSFQMKRLLKRRAVQESIDKTEKELANQGTAMNLAEWRNTFAEMGYIDPIELEKGSKQISSDENTRFLLVRDLGKKCKNEEKKLNDTQNKKVEEDEVKIEEKPTTSKGAQSKINLSEDDNRTPDLGSEYIGDLELAIALSLEDTHVYSQKDYEYKSDEQLRLNRNQRKVLKDSAVGPARAYMIEYGGLNTDEVEGIMDKTQVDAENEFDIEKFFKSDDTIDEKSKKLTTPEKDEFTLNYSGTESDAESLRLDDNKLKKISTNINNKNDNDLRLCVSGTESESDADSDLIEVPLTETKTITSISDSDSDSDFDLIEVPEIETKPIQKPGLEIKFNTNEIINVEDDIFADIFQKPNKINDTKSVSPTKNLVDRLNNIEKINNSNPIGNRISNETVQTILAQLKQQAAEINKITLNDIKIDKNSIVEIFDDESQILLTKAEPELIEIVDSEDQQLLLNEDNEIKTPTKNETISKFFKTDYIIKRTPEKLTKIDEEPSAKVTSPFFVKRTPKSKQKELEKKDSRTPSPRVEIKMSRASKTLFADNEDVDDSTSSIADKIKYTETIEASDESLQNEPVKPVNREQLIKEAADILKNQKTDEELQEMSKSLQRERQNLETERNRQDRMGMSITQRMSSECQDLLRLFGIPYVIAPMEAEAQCAFFDAIELTNGTITDDSDIWLFGGRTVYKNFFAQNKHVMEFKSDKIEKSFSVDRKKMIQLACLVGSDYTTGIHGIGAVTALEILASFAAQNADAENEKNGKSDRYYQINVTLSTLSRFRDWWLANKTSTLPPGNKTRSSLKKKLKNIELNEGFPNKAVIEAYLQPTIDDNREAFSWGYPDIESIREYAKKNFGWTTNKTNDILNPIIKKLNDKRLQGTIKNYFEVKGVTSSPQTLLVSKRVQHAVNIMTGMVDADTPQKVEKAKRGRPRTIKRKQIIEENDDTEKNNLPNKLQKEKDAELLDMPNVDIQTTKTISNKPNLKKLTRSTANREILENMSNVRKSPRLPNTKQVIPQREKYIKEMADKKEKAAAILKRNNNNVETVTKRKRK